MAKYYSEAEAKRRFGSDYADKYPSIDVSGSLIGMRNKFGWDLSKVIRVGKWYYHMRGHPYFSEVKR